MFRSYIAGLLILYLASDSHAATVLLNFDAPVPGSIADQSGFGTGFTHRLPGTGHGLPPDDSNLLLDWDAGLLSVTSTRTDINHGGVNLGEAEALGLLVSGLGADDLSVSMLVRGIGVPNGSDQLFLFAGTSSSQSIRAGFHEGNTYTFVSNHPGTGNFDAALFTAGLFEYATGDDILFSLRRTSGLWDMAWTNLTNSSASGSSASFSLPWLDANDDLYVGIYAANAGSPITHTNQIDSFSVRTGADARATVPEPASMAMWAGAFGVIVASRSSRRRTKFG